uniref:Uncharacterized protein n=1 Tax=Arundo donax TaxID=35708 RepID=A0A0A9CYJ9_ARUDO
MRRPIWGRDRPRSLSSETRGARVFSTLAHRNSGSLATMVAMLERGRPRPERKARTASELEGDLRWERVLDALRAWARVRPQLATR